MKIKLLSILLITILIFGMAACNSTNIKSPDTALTEQFEKMAEMEPGYVEMKLDINTNEYEREMGEPLNLSFKIKAQIDREKEDLCKVEIFYRMDSGDYDLVTTLIKDGRDLYINTKEMLDAIESISKKFGEEDT